MPRRLALLWLLILLLAPGCVVGKLLSPAGGGIEFSGRWPSGASVKRLHRQVIPVDAVRLLVTLSGDGMSQPQSKQLAQSNPPQTDFTLLFDNVPLGDKQVEVAAFDQNSQKIVSGQTHVLVQAGLIIDAYIELSGTGPVVGVGATPVPTLAPATAVPTPTSPTPTPAPGPTILVASTLAGNGTASFADGTGSAAEFYYPAGVAVDSSGNVYVGDQYNNRVRKIDPNGVVTTLAGQSTAGTADGTGTAAQFNGLYGLTVDTGGNVFVADYGNGSIRKITPGGVVTTLAGGNAGSVDGTGTAAGILGPASVAVDASGNLWVSDDQGNKLRKVTPAGVVTTVATGLQAPHGVAVDPAGNVYVVSTLGNDVLKVAPNGNTTVLAGSATAGTADGTGTAAQFNGPDGLTIDQNGILYVADRSNHIIRKLTTAGVVTTVAGSSAGFTDGGVAVANFNDPTGIAADSSGKLYVGDQHNHRIRKIQAIPISQLPAGTVLGVFTVGQNPQEIAIDAGNNVWVTNATDHSVTKLSSNWNSQATFDLGTGKSPLGIAIDGNGNPWVTDDVGSTNNVFKLSSTGTILGTFTAGPGAFGIGIDSGGNAWVANQNANTISKLNSAGTEQGPFAGGNAPVRVAIDKNGNVWITNGFSNDVTKLSSAGIPVGTSPFPVGAGPRGIAFDGNGNAWVANGGDSTVTKLSSTGVPVGSPVSIPGNPAGIAVDGSGNVWVTSQNGNSVYKLSSTGTVLGTFNVGRNPIDVAIDGLGNVWVVNNFDNNIMVLSK